MERTEVPKDTVTATEPTYQIITYVDGVQEWPAETIKVDEDYTLGDDLIALCQRLAAIAHENTTWVNNPPSVVHVVIPSEYDADNYELARGVYEWVR
jgi:hypothetical protein